MSNPDALNFRPAVRADYDHLGELMYTAVRTGKSLYNEKQRQAWVPVPRAGEDWTKRLDAQTIILAENEKQIAGFMSLTADAYLDFAYIRPSFQGSGLFRALYNHIEQVARDASHKRIWVHASLMAKPAFSAVGFSVTSEQTVMIGTESFERFEMEKIPSF
ncbi:MAG: GNAT family N-acetyltransferase [Parasphingorhabdus sp.]|uniref:GNAT family N-acetyltransferase n=1 Tax=Parasphingorhabdus sp. TaxID=2709688 RepID=UPI003299A61A